MDQLVKKQTFSIDQEHLCPKVAKQNKMYTLLLKRKKDKERNQREKSEG